MQKYVWGYSMLFSSAGHRAVTRAGWQPGNWHDLRAVQAALGAAQVPSVTLAEATEGGEAELQLDDDPSATLTIDTRACPLLVSVARVSSGFTHTRAMYTRADERLLYSLHA